MSTKGKILTALAVGAAIGSLLGVLFAPDKGTETRKKMSERGQKLSDDVKEKFKAGKDFLHNLKTNGKEEASI